MDAPLISKSPELAKAINSNLHDVEIKNGWITLYCRDEGITNLCIKSFIVPSDVSFQDPYPVNSIDYPIQNINIQGKDVQAKVLIIENKDPRTGKINLELNQEIKFKMNLFKENNCSFYEIKNDMSCSEVILIQNNKYIGNWLKINDLLNEQSLILQFTFEVKCTTDFHKKLINKNPGEQKKIVAHKHLPYIKQPTLYGTVRISGIKILKKKILKNLKKYNFAIGYRL